MENHIHVTIGDMRDVLGLLRDILARVTRTTTQGDSLMALAQSTQDLMATLRSRVAALSTEIASGTAGVRGDIATLKAMISSSTPPDPTEINTALQGIIDSIAPVQAAADALAALDAENPAATPSGTGSESGPVDTGA